MATTRAKHSQKSRGASLVEVLVTIVIFTVGILGVVQVFPGGLEILRQNRNATVANALARAEITRLQTEIDQLPEGVYPALYPAINAGLREITLDLNRNPGNLTPPATQLQSDGQLNDALGGLGPWALFSGANTTRRIIGEGRRIPAPRFADGPGGVRFGGVMQLQFAPIEINADGFTDPSFFGRPFLVYGNDLARFVVDEIPNAGRPLRQDYIVFVSEDGLEMTVPQGPYRADNPGQVRRYRLSARIVRSGGPTGTFDEDVVQIIQVPNAASPTAQRINVPIDLATQYGAGFIRIDPDTVQVSRLFDEIPPAGTFLTDADIRGNSALLDDASYQFTSLSDRLGILMFNPKGASYTEQRRQGRTKLVARVDYGVQDWRNLREDFRVPTGLPSQHKLIMNSIKVKDVSSIDGTRYKGLGFLIPVLPAPAPEAETDFLLLDRETGGVILPSGYKVDKSTGLISFIDVDNNPANGLTADIVYQDPPPNLNVNGRIDIRNRPVRAIYQANGEFAVQPQKATSRYRVTYSATLGYAQCYPGRSNGVETTSSPNRLYFTLSEVGKKVILGEVWYRDTGGNLKSMNEQEFLIKAPGVGDPFPYAYIDLTEKDPAAASFDYTRGFAVRTVRGSSVSVRVFYNPETFKLTNDPDENMRLLGIWLSNMRKVTTETFLLKGATE